MQHVMMEESGKGMPERQNDDSRGDPIMEDADQRGFATAEGKWRGNDEQSEEAQGVLLRPAETKAKADYRQKKQIKGVLDELCGKFGDA